MTQVLTTEEFWKRMTDPRFVRTGRLTGQIGTGVFVAVEAPEDAPGFLQRKVSAAILALVPR